MHRALLLSSLPVVLGAAVSAQSIVGEAGAGGSLAPSPSRTDFAEAPSLLWDQTDFGSGVGVPDQDAEVAYDAYDSEAADDFVVGWGHVVQISEIHTMGVQTAKGTPDSVDLRIYPDDGGQPASSPACDYPALSPGGADSLVLILPSSCVVPGGVYWVAIQVNQDLGTEGQHGWTTRTVKTGYGAKWRNPADGFGSGCADWADVPTCGVGGSHPDLLFQIWGYTNDDTLHYQKGDSAGGGMAAQDFESGLDAYDSEGADDFVVDWVDGWNVERVETIGEQTTDGSPDSVDVRFYPDAGGVPGGVAECSFLGVATDDPVDLGIDLPGGCHLDPGHWWVSVQSNQDAGFEGQYIWYGRDSQSGDKAVWRNPGGAFGLGCPSWETIETCGGGFYGVDFQFALRGAPSLIFEDNLEIGWHGRWSSCSGCEM